MTVLRDARTGEYLIPFDALPPLPVALLHRLDPDAWRRPLFLAPDMPDDPTEDE